MDVTISAGFSSRPYDLRMRVFTIQNNVAGNYSRYRGDRYAYSRSGNGSYMLDCRTVDSWIAGNYAGGCYSLDFRGDFVGKTIGLGVYDTGNVNHASNGTLSFTSRIRMLNASVFGSADTGDVWMAGDFLPRKPPPPTPTGLTNITPTGMRYTYSSNGDGGSPITAWQYQYSTSGTFASGNSPVLNGDRSEDVSGLTPGTRYYWRSRGVNAHWTGDWSAIISASTLPATAPGMSLMPSLSGTGMTVTLTPPGGASGVTKYRVEYRVGTGAATPVEKTSSPITVAGLTPGQTYQWRASAFFGSYESPYTDWTPLAQPNPNTSPGDYFDGASAPRGDLTFAWTGTANNSTSHAIGVGVAGWNHSSAMGPPLDAVLQRVTGGRSGQYAGRLVIKNDFTVAGARVGMNESDLGDRAEVEVNSTYIGSAYVRPSRAQLMAAEIAFFDASGTRIGGYTTGDPIWVTDTIGWTRLVVDAPAPAGAESAIVRVTDIDGIEHAEWKSGEWYDVDDIMVSLTTLYDYFDGSTPDSALFDYEWLGTPHQSASARYELDPVDTDPLADPDCPTPPAPPTLPTIPSDCIVEVGTWRRYTLQIPSSEVRLWSSTLPTLMLTTQASAERQVRVRYYPNPDGLAPEGVTQDGWDAELILTYIPANTEIVLDAVTQLVTASVNGGDPIPANRLLYGTGGIPATWPELRCGIGYVVTMDVPLDAPAGNLDARVIVTQRM